MSFVGQTTAQHKYSGQDVPIYIRKHTYRTFTLWTDDNKRCGVLVLDKVYRPNAKSFINLDYIANENNYLKSLGTRIIQITAELSHLTGKGGAIKLYSFKECEPFYYHLGFYPEISNNRVLHKKLLRKLPAYEKAVERFRQTGQTYNPRRPLDPYGLEGRRMYMRDASRRVDQRRFATSEPMNAQQDGKRYWIEQILREPILFETEQRLNNGTLILD